MKYRTSNTNGLSWPSANSATAGTPAAATSSSVRLDRPRPSKVSTSSSRSGHIAARLVIVVSSW